MAPTSFKRIAKDICENSIQKKQKLNSRIAPDFLNDNVDQYIHLKRPRQRTAHKTAESSAKRKTVSPKVKVVEKTQSYTLEYIPVSRTPMAVDIPTYIPTPLSQLKMEYFHEEYVPVCITPHTEKIPIYIPKPLSVLKKLKHRQSEKNVRTKDSSSEKKRKSAHA